MRYLLIIFHFFAFFGAIAQNPDLSNGRYFVNSSFVYFPDYVLELSDSGFTSFYAEDTVSGTIFRINGEFVFDRDSSELYYPRVDRIPQKETGEFSMRVIRLKEDRYAFKIKQRTVLNVIYDQGIITPAEMH